MAMLLDRLKSKLERGPRLDLSVMLTARLLACLHVPRGSRGNAGRAVLPLEPGCLAPSFDQANIRDSAALGRALRDSLREARASGREAALLIPEACQKSTVLSFEEFPSSQEEGRELVLWRLKKQIPSLPEDVRLSYDVQPGGNPIRVFASLARSSVVREYEDFFASNGLKLRRVALPTLELFRLLDSVQERDVLVANLDEETVGLLAVVEGQAVLYRFKLFLAGASPSIRELAEAVIKETVQTLKFLEDREKKKAATLMLRVGWKADPSDLVGLLQGRLSLPVRFFDPPAAFGLNARERHFLAPLLGQAI